MHQFVEVVRPRLRHVSTRDQNLDRQRDAIVAAGAERIFADTITGTARVRPELDRLLAELRPGDVVTVTKYDRIARSLPDLLGNVAVVRGKGAGFRSLGEDIDTTTPAGRLAFHVFASIAQFERERIVERTKEGLVRQPAQKVDVKRMRDEDHRSIREIAALFKVSDKTVRRVV
jgi:DNA invertase Pin-like site-specific DNA recombinase